MHNEQRTPEWFAERLGKVGASEISKIINKKKDGSRYQQEEDLLIQKATERITNIKTEGFINQAMQDGIDREPDARQLYELVTKNKVEEVGFIAHPTIKMSGASPDGLIIDSHKNEGVLEIKCPIDTTHTKTLIDKKLPTQYMPQVQFQMACTGFKYAHFVSYSPNFPDKQKLIYILVPRDDKYIKQMEDALEIFLTQVDALVEKIKEK